MGSALNCLKFLFTKDDDQLEQSVFLRRGSRFALKDYKGRLIKPNSSWAAFMRKIHGELREIAKSVPRANSK